MYKSWQVEGLMGTDQAGKLRMMPKKLTVRYTSDQIGKSLSISDDKAGVMFQVPMDRIIKELTEADK